MKKINLNVDGYKIEAVEGQSLLEASLEAGIYIPHLCYHPDLTPEGGCKLCTVKVEGKSGLVQSCETLVEEGMCVNTKTDKVKQLRMVALELMLASHPKDCTSCDKYLNCELQAIMQYMGVVHSRLHEVEKENTKLTASDQFIKREMNRCIQCGRCVRACDELRGIGALAFNKKEGETYIGIKDDKLLTEKDCRFCGACVEVCPTGAIQDVKGIFSKDSPRHKALIPCKDTCPAHTDIPTYVRLTEQGQYSEAVSVIREKLTFPHALGYVCTHTCETGCKRSYLDDAVSIRAIKRFAVENDKAELWKSKCHKEVPNGKKVAVVGAGPSGMTGAYYLAKKGYEVTVFERQAKAGGMLTYGIPKYRLPQAVVNKEIETLKEMGMDLQVNTDIKSIDFLKSRGFDAVLVAVGTHQGKRPPQYQKDWVNAYNAVDICRLSNQDKLPDLGDTVTVYGGGNVAFDAARSVKKKGAKNVRIVCLEARDRMLADDEEVLSAIEEGIEILNSMTMLELEEKENRVSAIKLMDVISFEFGSTGLNMVTREGSEKILTTDSIIFATGQQPDIDDGFGVELFRGAFIKTDSELQTSEMGIFAAGDAIYGTKSVVEAIESGRQAAVLMDKYLGGDGLVEDVLYERIALEPSIGIIENFSNLKRYDHLLNSTEAHNEGIRCLQCDLRLDIQKVKYWVDPQFKTVKVVES